MNSVEACGSVTALTLGLPSTTSVPGGKGRLPKEGFYHNMQVNARLKRRFIDETESFVMLAQIDARSTGIPAGETVTKIYVLGIEARTDEPDTVLIEQIARYFDEQSTHRARILFAWVRGDACTPAVFRNASAHEGLMEGTVYAGDVRSATGIPLRLHGADLDAVWDTLCAQIILDSDNATNLDRRIVAKHRLVELDKEIARLTKAHAKATQIAKRNDLWNRLQIARSKRKTVERDMLT